MLDFVPLPLGGMKRALGFESQEPQTSPHMINVWPIHARKRLSIGSRPGTRRSHNGVTNGAINLLHAVDLNEATGKRWIDDGFDGYNVEERWNTSVGGLVAPTLDFLNHRLYALYHATNKYGYILDALGQSTTDTVFVTLTVLPYNGVNAATYRVYFLLNDATPAPTDAGVEVVLTLSNSSGNDRLDWTVNALDTGGVHVGSSPYTGNFTATGIDTRVLRVAFLKSTGEITIFLDSVATKSPAAISITNPTNGVGTRIGWSMRATSAGGRAIVDRARVNWVDASDDDRVTQVSRLLSAGGGKVYHETYGNDLAEVNSSYSVLRNEPLQAANRLNKAYIADWGDILYEDTNAVVGYNDPSSDGVAPFYWKFESSPQINISALGIDATNFVVEVVQLYNSSTPVTAEEFPVGAYTFTFETGSATNSRVVCVRPSTDHPTTAGVTHAHIRIRRGPKIYDASAGTLAKLETSQSVTTETTTYGIVPVGCRICCQYRSRLILADDTSINASRTEDFTDFGYLIDTDDPRSAWSTTLSEVAGGVPKKPTVVTPIGDDYLLMASVDLVRWMIGDIAAGGSIETKSPDVGIIGPEAWCRVPDGRIFFLGVNGLNVMPIGGSPQPVSEDVIPDELINLSTEHLNVSMAWESRFDGILITVGGKREAQRHDSWLYHLKTGGFFPWRSSDDVEPTRCLAPSVGYFNRPKTLIGCRDGYIRAFEPEAALDDGGLQLDSILSMGPFRANSEKTLVRRLAVNLSAESRPTYITVETADTPEEAVFEAVQESAYDFRHTLAAGRNRLGRVRGTGGAIMLSIRSKSGGKWQLDELRAEMVPAHSAR